MHDARLTELESKLAYQEDLVQDLNKIVIAMQKQIDDLELRNKILRDNLKQIEQSLPNDQDPTEVPPHY
ncbi:MAG: SlyX family protein [Pseudomonadota bacterium]